jgi:hypothetical protein
MSRVILGYGAVANQFGVPSRVLSGTLRTAALSLPELAQELDEGRPILAGVSFFSGFSLPGISQHAVVLVGYDATDAVPIVYINDPFPYELLQRQAPYLTVGGQQVIPGRYAVPYSVLVNELRWDNSIFGIQ